MKRVFYRSLFAVLCVSMLSAAIPVRVIAEEERRQENTLEQVDAGAVGNSVDSVTSEIGNKSIKNDSDLANPISHQAEPQVSLASDGSAMILNKPQRQQQVDISTAARSRRRNSISAGASCRYIAAQVALRFSIAESRRPSGSEIEK